MTWATSQRCALPVGSSRPPSLPDSSPWLTAHSRASTAQAEAEPLSTKPFRLPWAEVWPENRASLALERAMGFEVLEGGRLWYVS